MARILLVGGSDDGTAVERDGNIYSDLPVEGYSGVMIFGIPDPERKWSSDGFALVPAVVAGPLSNVITEMNGAVVAAFEKWTNAQP